MITYGATITSMCMPDRQGHVDDIILGFDDIEGLLKKYTHIFL